MKYLLLFLFLISINSFSQKQLKIDSLKTKLNSTVNQEKKAIINLEISKIIENKNRDSSKIFAKNAEKIALIINNKNLLSKSYLQQAILFYKQKKDDIALRFLNKIDSLYKIDKIISEEYFMSKIYRAEISKFTFTMPGVLQAKQYVLQALKLAKKVNNEKFINLAEYRLGEWHGFMSQAENPKQHLDTASVYMKKALRYYQKINDYEFIARVYYTMASINVSQKDYNSAETNYKKRLDVIKKSNDSTKIGEAYYGLGSIYRNFKQPNKGLKYLDSAALIFNKFGFSSDGRRKNLYRDYAYLYELKKDYKNAFINMQKAIVFKDTLYEEKNNKLAIELEAVYLNKEKLQEIQLLKQQKKNQLNLLLSGLFITTLAGFFFYKQFRNRQKTTKKLKELDKAKSNFFTNISHEFRTPLTLISGPLQEQLKKDNLTSIDRTNFEMMFRNSKRLIVLVDQLLDLSKIEVGSLQLKVAKNKLMHLISTLADGFTYKAKQKQLHYIININTTKINTWFDKDVIEKIITNLISNAIKYTPNKGSINCNTFIKDASLYFEIKNTGKGISKEEINKIFERFYQLDENKQGVGIGLALVKELVKLHKGILTVDSTPNQWTTFKIVIPINKNSFKENEIIKEYSIENNLVLNPNLITENLEENIITENQENPLLLIVDDNTDIRTYISTIFKDNYSILQAKNGKEGIAIAIEQIPDIIISDIMMPVKNGIELCNTLKIDERTSHIPIILLTAKAGEENEIEGIKTGADSYITKPFNNELLKLKVKKLIENITNLQKRFSQEVILRPTDVSINSTDAFFLERIQDILDNKIVESSFNTEDFCETVGMSRMQLHRKIKAIFGMSTSKFIRSQRLKLAAQFLKKSDVNVSQIGYSVGFNDHAYFSKRFKEMYNCTPSEYANK